MNVVFFHDARLKKYENKYYTSGGLTANYLQKYLKFFSKVTVCTRQEVLSNKKETETLSESSGNNIDFNGVERLNLFSLLFGKDKKKIQNNIQNNEFAIVRLPSFIGIVACRQLRKAKKPYLIEMVACPWDALWNYGKLSKKLLAPFVALLNRYEVKKAPNVIYVSNEFLQSRYPTKGNNIGCSDVNIEKIDEINLENRLNKIENKKSEEIYRLGLIGSLNVAYKGHNTAIKAISLLREKYNIELHFLGSGDKTKWEKMSRKYHVEDKIYFDGTLPGGEAVYQWLDELDLYLIPSLQEGLPRSLIEAMSRACVAIGTNAGGIPELISKENIIQKKNAKQLAKRMEELIQNKEEMKQIAIQNFHKSLEFKKETLQEKREEFYRRMLGDM